MKRPELVTASSRHPPSAATVRGHGRAARSVTRWILRSAVAGSTEQPYSVEVEYRDTSGGVRHRTDAAAAGVWQSGGMDRRALRRWVGDAVLAVVVGYVGVHGTIAAQHFQPESRHLDMLGSALIVAAALCLVVRRRWPLVTLALVAMVTSSYLEFGYAYGPVLL